MKKVLLLMAVVMAVGCATTEMAARSDTKPQHMCHCKDADCGCHDKDGKQCDDKHQCDDKNCDHKG